ncbi:hypothetical protein B0H13DRAFT_1929108 [Mycena leptocephala]|nr:hypothetical protein B0H13DRAFT_1929108 [Mycena leptocephala]
MTTAKSPLSAIPCQKEWDKPVTVAARSSWLGLCVNVWKTHTNRSTCISLIWAEEKYIIEIEERRRKRVRAEGASGGTMRTTESGAETKSKGRQKVTSANIATIPKEEIEASALKKWTEKKQEKGKREERGKEDENSKRKDKKMTYLDERQRRRSKRTAFAGEPPWRRTRVLVSMVQQLKHLRTRSLNFIAASSVCMTGRDGAIGVLRMVPGSGYCTYPPCAMGNGWGAYCTCGGGSRRSRSRSGAVGGGMGLWAEAECGPGQRRAEWRRRSGPEEAADGEGEPERVRREAGTRGIHMESGVYSKLGGRGVGIGRVEKNYLKEYGGSISATGDLDIGENVLCNQLDRSRTK